MIIFPKSADFLKLNLQVDDQVFKNQFVVESKQIGPD